jgi:hypothetical protein
MGVAYCATHLALDRRAALKAARASWPATLAFASAFQQESRLAARIVRPKLVDSHPGYQAGFLGQNGAASPPAVAPRNWPPEAGNGEVATGRAPSRAPAGVPTTPTPPSRRRRISTRPGRRRSSARPWP